MDARKCIFRKYVIGIPNFGELALKWSYGANSEEVFKSPPVKVMFSFFELTC